MPQFNLNDYEPVEQRIKRMYKDHPDARIITENITTIQDRQVGTWVTKSYLYLNAADQEKKAIAEEWDKLAQVGPAAMRAIAHQEKAKLTAQFLSLDEGTGKVMMRQARERLRDAKTLLKASGYHESMRFLSTHVALESPVQKLEKAKTEDSESAKAEQALREMLARMGIKNPT